MRLERRAIRVNSKRSVSSVWAIPDTNPAEAKGAFILAHGAGAGMDHEFICHFHEALGRAGYLSIKFNFPYKEEGRKAPDKGALLEEAYRRVLVEAQSSQPEPGRVLIGGKSMGGRIASYLAAAGVPIGGAFFLGYPLHPPRRPKNLRTGHFPDLRCPTLFIQGSRDALCDLDLLRQHLPTIPGPVRLHVVQWGDHSFSVPKKSGKTISEVRDEVLAVLLDWAQTVTRPSPL